MADLSKVKSPLAGLRFRDLTHHAITELAESQASDATIMAIAVHVSRQMLEHYSHVRLGLKRKAPDELADAQERFLGAGVKNQLLGMSVRFHQPPPRA